MGSFRESPGGTQNPVAPRAGSFVPGPVCDDFYTLLVPFGSPVPDRCWGGAEFQFGLNLVARWSPDNARMIPK